MAKLTLADPANFNSTTLSQIASNHTLIEAALENTLSRDGTSPNQMEADFDMNNNDILNANSVTTTTLILDGVEVVPTSIVTAEQLLRSNNLSDVDDVAASLNNLGIFDVYSVDLYTDLATYSPSIAPNTIRTRGYSVVGDGGEATYKKVGAQPTHPGRVSLTLADASVVWYELIDDIAVPEMFGASGYTGATDDLSLIADSTAALANWAEYVNETNAQGLLHNLYRSTAVIAFTKDGLVIEGVNSQVSGILFDACAGITLNQTTGGQMTRFAFRKFAMLTNSDRALGYSGLDIDCTYSPGGADSGRIIEEMYFGGQRMFETQNEIGVMSAETAANRKQAWAKAIVGVDIDNTIIRDNRIHGPIFDWNDSYSGVDISYGIHSTDSTAIECYSNKILFPTYGARVGGESEATLFLENAFGACRGGILYEGFSGAANFHKAVRNHVSAHEFGIKFNEDGATPGSSLFNLFEQNLIFMYPGSSFGNFIHMNIRTNQSQLIFNTLRVAASDDATVATGLVDTGILLEGTFNRVMGNTFLGLDLCIDIVSGSVSTQVIANMTQGSDAVGSVPMTDAGTDTTCMFNSGDAKSELWPAVIYDGEKKIDIWSHSPVEIYGGAVGAKYQKASFPNVTGTPVNYLEFVPSATGSPVFIRAAGTDADIDLRLISKGAGLVRFGTRTASADVPVTGYIEIKDSAGTTRRLAVVG